MHRPGRKWTDDEWNALVSQTANRLLACTTGSEAKSVISQLATEGLIGNMNYSVWSDKLVCSSCNGEFTFWHTALDHIKGEVLEKFRCPHCGSETSKDQCERVLTSYVDPETGLASIGRAQEIVLLDYAAGSIRANKEADEFDRAVVKLIEAVGPRVGKSATPMLGIGERWGDTWRAGYHKGVSHSHHFYTRRNFLARAELDRRALLPAMKFIAQALTTRMTRLNKVHTSNFFHGGGGWNAGNISGTLYIPSLSVETSVLHLLPERIEAVKRLLPVLQSMQRKNTIVQAASATSKLGTACLDYVFTDPPFGGNLIYGELNFLWEAWLGVVTSRTEEAIESASQRKGLAEYQLLMAESFRRYYEALKPGRWMTVEFHNSADAVWNAIHEALERVGFVVADVRVIDKQQYSFKQVTTSSATKKDLVISCYKPSDRFEREFERAKGTPEGVVEFLGQHLEMLPVAPVNASGKLEQLPERTLGVLYDRMIAYHLVRGARIPLSATEFGKLLAEHFFSEDGMWFLPHQLAQYQARKMRGAEPEQLTFYMQDEKSAVRWIRSEIEREEQTLGDLTPKFMRELKEWPKTEPRPELRDLLREYFIPNPDGTWAVPDPDKAEHLETLRKQQMLKLFSGYLKEGKTLKTFRKEAILEGFKHCWQTKQYGVIVRLSEKIKPADLQADRELMQFYDIAKDLAPEDGSGQMELVLE